MQKQPPATPAKPTPPTPPTPIAISDRRRTPRRRLRDRIASLDTTANPVLHSRPGLKNHVLLVEDDLRQTALAIGGVEAFLSRSMELLEEPGLTAEALGDHADDDAVLEKLEELSDSIVNLRRRMVSIAAAMK